MYIEYSSSQRIRYRPLDRSGYLLSAASAAQRTIIDYFAMQAVLAVCSEVDSDHCAISNALSLVDNTLSNIASKDLNMSTFVHVILLRSDCILQCFL